MTRCFYHTDLVQNAVFHNFQNKLHSFNIQDHGSTRGLLISETVQKISKITHTAIRAVLTFDKRQICEEIVKELPFNVIKNLLSLFFINGSLN